MSTPLDQIAEDANRGIQIRVDSESSMLKGEERAVAGNAVKRIIDRYQGALRERGGYQNVLQEMSAYLATKTGDPLSLTDPTHRQGLDPYRTALRCLLDPGESGKSGVKKASFENLLHPQASSYTIEYANDKPRMELRELLAYYWLAASDPNMSLSEEQLADVPGDISDEEKRNILIEGEKENLIIKIQEIRRAHNGDPQYHSETSMTDEPSCGPGTFGRIVSSPLYNPIGKLQVNPAAGFPWNIEAFIFKKFQESGKEAVDGYQSYVEKYLLYLEPEETPDFIKASKRYKDFLDEISGSKENLLRELEKEYGDALTPERREYAEKLYEEICNGLDLSNQNAHPRQTLINRMNESVEKAKKKEILETITEEMKPQYIEHYNKISEELTALTEQLMSYDFEHATNSELTKNKTDIIEKYNDIIKRKELGSSLIAEKYQNLYKGKLEEEGLSFLSNEITKLGLAELDDEGKQHSKLDKIRSTFDSKHAEYLAKEKTERAKRIKKALEKFEKSSLSDDLNSVNIKIQNEILSMQRAIEKINENLNVTDLSVHEKNILQNSEKITEISKNANFVFLDLLLKEGLSPSPEEMDEANQKLQELLEIKQNKEQLSQAQSKLDELKKVKLVHDNYQDLLQTAKYETYKIALSLYNKVNDYTLSLLESNPGGNSLERKQLDELELARQQLKEHIRDPHTHNELEISKVIEKAENLKKIVTDMKKKLDTVGYPGKFKRFTDRTRNHVNKLLNWMLKLKIKAKKSVKKHEVQEILSLTTLFDISKIKNAADKIEKPKYALNKSVMESDQSYFINKIGREIGRGDTSSFFSIDGHPELCLSVIDLKKISKEKLKQLDKNLGILNDLGRLTGKQVIKNKIYIVQNRLPGEQLINFLLDKRAGAVNRESIISNISLSINIINAMEKLHEKGIVHNDFHAANILFDKKNNSVSIIDFDLSEKIPYGQKKIISKDNRNFGEHVAPENRLTGETSVATDYYALGCLLTDGGAIGGIGLDSIDMSSLVPEDKITDLRKSLSKLKSDDVEERKKALYEVKDNLKNLEKTLKLSQTTPSLKFK